MVNYLTSKGVQHFSITINAGSTTGTASVNAVGNGAFIIWGGQQCAANTTNDEFSYLTKTDSTTITATRTGTTNATTAKGCIVDGDTTNLIKSVQYGTVTIAATATSGTASISAVTNNNTAIHLLGWNTTNTGYSAINENPVLSLAGTTVTATRIGTNGTLIVGFVAIEFQSGVMNQSIQNISATNSSSVTSYTTAIISADVNNSLCIYGGSMIATVTANHATSMMYGSLTNATTFTVNINTGSANAKTYNCSLVNYVPGVLHSNLQRGTTVLTGVASNTSTITSANKSNSLFSWLNNTSSTATGNLIATHGDGVLTNSTTVTVTKGTSTNNITGSWEVAEFPSFVGGRVFDFMGFFD